RVIREKIDVMASKATSTTRVTVDMRTGLVKTGQAMSISGTVPCNIREVSASAIAEILKVSTAIMKTLLLMKESLVADLIMTQLITEIGITVTMGQSLIMNTIAATGWADNLLVSRPENVLSAVDISMVPMITTVARIRWGVALEKNHGTITVRNVADTEDHEVKVTPNSIIAVTEITEAGGTKKKLPNKKTWQRCRVFL